MAATLCLSACAGTLPDVGAPDLKASTEAVRASMSSVCPQLKPIGNAEMDRIAGAIEALPADSPLVGVTGDWLQMRDETRACRGQAVPKTGK